MQPIQQAIKSVSPGGHPPFGVAICSCQRSNLVQLIILGPRLPVRVCALYGMVNTTSTTSRWQQEKEESCRLSVIGGVTNFPGAKMGNPVDWS